MRVAEYRWAIGLDPSTPTPTSTWDRPRRPGGEAEATGAGGPPRSTRGCLPHHELAALLMDEGDYGRPSPAPGGGRLEPESFLAHLDLGICYAQKGFFAEAERAYGARSSLPGDDLLLTYNRAALYALGESPSRPSKRFAERWTSTPRGSGTGSGATRCSTAFTGLPSMRSWPAGPRGIPASPARDPRPPRAPVRRAR